MLYRWQVCVLNFCLHFVPKVTSKAVTTPVGPKRTIEQASLGLSDLIANKTAKRAKLEQNRPKMQTPFPLPDVLSGDVFDRTGLLLNIDQMIDEKIPLPFEEAGQSWQSEWKSFVTVKVRPRSYAFRCFFFILLINGRNGHEGQ